MASPELIALIWLHFDYLEPDLAPFRYFKIATTISFQKSTKVKLLQIMFSTYVYQSTQQSSSSVKKIF